MAEGFETCLYELIGTVADARELELFKAKGDKALLLGDQEPQVDTEDLFEDVVALLVEFGVPSPPQSFKDLPPDRPKGTFRAYRDFSFGELKTIAETKAWPDDALSWQKTPRMWPRLLLIFAVGGGLAVFISVVIHRLLP